MCNEEPFKPKAPCLVYSFGYRNKNIFYINYKSLSAATVQTMILRTFHTESTMFTHFFLYFKLEVTKKKDK